MTIIDIQRMGIDMEPSGKGYFRVVNIRGDKDYGPEPGETVIRMDRTNALFGNPHHMKAQTPAERARVIALWSDELDADIAAKGPRWERMTEIASRILSGERFVGECWCKPLDCHVDVTGRRIMEMVAAMEMAREQTDGVTNDSACRAKTLKP